MKSILVRLVVAATAAAFLGACDAASDTETAAESTASATQDTGDAPAGGGAAGDTQPATVALSFDGQPVPIAAACNGADGAVLVTTEGEVTVTLVQEEGTALRYNGEGMTAETTDVTIEEIGVSTVYRATLESEQVPAVDVTLELADTSDLEACQA